MTGHRPPFDFVVVGGVVGRCYCVVWFLALPCVRIRRGGVCCLRVIGILSRLVLDLIFGCIYVCVLPMPPPERLGAPGRGLWSMRVWSGQLHCLLLV